MTPLLEKAFAEAAKLPESELESERTWDEAFANSADALATLADEALAEHRAGRTERFEPEDL